MQEEEKRRQRWIAPGLMTGGIMPAGIETLRNTYNLSTGLRYNSELEGPPGSR
jgi:hypothetical protein